MHQMDLSTIQMALNVIIVFETFQSGLWGALPANETTGADQIELLKIRAESIKLEEFKTVVGVDQQKSDLHRSTPSPPHR